ncbi:c-type cytochrome [Silvibacterium acidisoli]|uniref:c-type cytochrome n=1 Tax=Acidobacteriaceae bacterium ZG23-2 TaxID=2883246 RepID=UPI00406D0F0D
MRRVSYGASKLSLLALGAAFLSACGPPPPPSKPLSELTPQEHAGRAVFIADCARCHHANDQKAYRGPGLQALYKEKYLPSGAPANDDRVSYVIIHGRNMMPAFGDTMDSQQLADLLAYLRTL